MLSNNFVWKPDLPNINDNNIREFINEVNDILSVSNGIKKLFENELEYYLDNNKIKRYKRLNSYNKAKTINEIGLTDLSLNEFIILDDLGYEIAIKHDSSIKPIKTPEIKNPQTDWDKRKELLKKISDSGNFIKLNKPWQINIEKIKVKQLKTQDNIKIFFSVGLDASIFDVNSLNKEDCKHKFRLYNTKQAAWEWKLVWECIHCGVLCHCKCFETAINQYNKEMNPSPEREKRKTGIDLTKLPYIKDACEICRDEPSTHKHCHEMYARSEFELRYGAYVKKKYYELKAKNTELADDESLKRYANNLVREKLGFRKIGKQFVTETELYRIVNSIFDNKEVIHHYREDWLEGQELDIFVPELDLAIEYNGKQHYKPIKAWGGEKALKENKKRDELKISKCKNEGVKLVTFNYKEKEQLSKSFVYEKIKSALSKY